MNIFLEKRVKAKNRKCRTFLQNVIINNEIDK